LLQISAPEPIIRYLLGDGPYGADFEGFSLVYGYANNSGADSFYIEVRAEENARSRAIQQIYDMGVDAANYKIKFEPYTNPFTGKVDDDK
jgi:hypothetical protein